MTALGVQRLLVTSLPNVTWLTGFDGSAAAAMVEPDRVVLVTDRRYAEPAAELVAGSDAMVLKLVEHSYDETIVEMLAQHGGPAGFEASALTVQRWRWLEAVLSAQGSCRGELWPIDGAIERERVIKDDWEADVLREAGRRLSAVAHGVLADLEAGRRESEVAQAIEAGLRRAGFTRPAFDTIVASGPRSALPHARAADRVLVPGELIVLDFGGVYGGYCVDLTRTVVLGAASSEARRVHAAVAEAQHAATGIVRPGTALADVDAAARAVLTREGLGGRFTHGTGHGLGLEVHEAPRVGPARAHTGRTPLPGTVLLPEIVQAGMVFTVEPGVYIPGWGGVRIEDDLLVTAAGAEWLTSVPSDLVIG